MIIDSEKNPAVSLLIGHIVSIFKIFRPHQNGRHRLAQHGKWGQIFLMLLLRITSDLKVHRF